MDLAEERFDLKARLIHAFEHGKLAYSMPHDDMDLFADVAREICVERGVSLDCHVDYRVGRVTLRANRGFALSVAAFERGSNTPEWQATNREWGQVVGFERGC